MKRGRLFSDVEITERRRVVIVNERLARTVWPGQDPIGKRLRWGLDTPQNPNPWLTVVGVVGDVADGRLGAPTYLHAYEPFSQFPDVVLDNVPSAFGRHLKLAVRTDGDPRALASPLRSTIAGIDPNLAVESIATMDDRIADSVAPRRFSAMTLAAFAGGGSRLLEAGWPVHHVQHMLGHATLQQTSTYLNATLRGLHESMRNLEEARKSCKFVASTPSRGQRPARKQAPASNGNSLIR